MKRKKSKCVSYAKWGYIFLIPFFLVYIIFQLIPLLSTFYNSFFENYRVGLMQVGPTFVGFKNYKEILFNSELPMYFMDDGIYSTDVFLIITCIMVYGFKIKIKMFRFFQDSYIYAEPDYGICIFNVILYNILRCRSY